MSDIEITPPVVRRSAGRNAGGRPGPRMEFGNWTLHPFSEAVQAELRLYSGCGDRRVQALLQRMLQEGNRWCAADSAPGDPIPLADDLKTTLEQLAKACTLLGQVHGVDGAEDILRRLSPYWDGSEPFFFASGEEHSVFYPNDLAAEINDRLGKSDGRPRLGAPRTQRAADNLIESWIRETRSRPSTTTNKRRGSIISFYKLALSKMDWTTTNPSWRAIEAVSGEPQRFILECEEHLYLAVKRWLDQHREQKDKRRSDPAKRRLETK